MWIIPKSSPFSRFAAVTEVLSSAWPEHWRTLLESLLWRSKPTHWRTWSQRLKRASWMSRFCGRICEPSRQSDFEDALILSLRATRASRSVSPASGKVPKTPDTFGRLLLESSRQLNLFGASSRTSPDTLASDSPTFIEAYEAWVTQLRLACLQRQSVARPTNGNGSLSWRSPAEQPAAIKTDKLTGDLGKRMYHKETGRLAQYGLEQQVNWPTVSVCGQHNRKGASANSGDGLSTAVKQWPTPNVPERGPEYSKKHRPESGGLDLQSSVQLWPTPAAQNFRDGRASEEMMSSNSRPLQEVVVSGHPAPANLSTNGKSREFWATPAADYPGDDVRKLSLSPAGKATRIDNGRMVQTSLTVQLGVQRNKLNPNWVEQLMGLQVGWTQIGVDNETTKTGIEKEWGFDQGRRKICVLVGTPKIPQTIRERPRVSQSDGLCKSRDSRNAIATSVRVDRLRLLGNGVVPQQAEIAFRYLYEGIISAPAAEAPDG